VHGGQQAPPIQGGVHKQLGAQQVWACADVASKAAVAMRGRQLLSCATPINKTNSLGIKSSINQPLFTSVGWWQAHFNVYIQLTCL
jgi:hypothetical protein